MRKCLNKKRCHILTFKHFIIHKLSINYLPAEVEVKAEAETTAATTAALTSRMV